MTKLNDDIAEEVGRAVHDVLHSHGLCQETGFVAFLTEMHAGGRTCVISDLEDATVDAIVAAHLMHSALEGRKQ